MRRTNCIYNPCLQLLVNHAPNHAIFDPQVSLFQGGQATPGVSVRTDSQFRLVHRLHTSLCEQIKEQLDMLSFARRLWNYFRSLACRSIRAGKTLTDHSLDFVMQTIDRQVEQFLEASLQLDVLSLQIDDDPAVLSG